jgi:hypothetical protein
MSLCAHGSLPNIRLRLSAGVPNLELKYVLPLLAGKLEVLHAAIGRYTDVWSQVTALLFPEGTVRFVISSDARDTSIKLRLARGNGDTSEYCCDLPCLLSILYWAVAHDSLGRHRWRPRLPESRVSSGPVAMSLIDAVILNSPPRMQMLSLQLIPMGGAIPVTIGGDPDQPHIDVGFFLHVWSAELEIQRLHAWWSIMLQSVKAKQQGDSEAQDRTHFFVGDFSIFQVSPSRPGLAISHDLSIHPSRPPARRRPPGNPQANPGSISNLLDPAICEEGGGGEVERQGHIVGCAVRGGEEEGEKGGHKVTEAEVVGVHGEKGDKEGGERVGWGMGGHL